MIDLQMLFFSTAIYGEEEKSALGRHITGPTYNAWY
jgi:hypothetical protein